MIAASDGHYSTPHRWNVLTRWTSPQQYNTKVMVTAASESGMPQTPEERVDNASRMVDAANDKGIAIEDIFIDPLFLSHWSGHGERQPRF